MYLSSITPLNLNDYDLEQFRFKYCFYLDIKVRLDTTNRKISIEEEIFSKE
jgi:hypothetical protein